MKQVQQLRDIAHELNQIAATAKRLKQRETLDQRDIREILVWAHRPGYLTREGLASHFVNG